MREVMYYVADDGTQFEDEDVIGEYIPDALNEYNPNPGLYAYDHDREKWFHVGERISELQDMADEVMAVINGV